VIVFDNDAPTSLLTSMPCTYQIIALVERTPAWWEWRRSGVGSSDAASILDEPRAKSVERLLLEKQQLTKQSAARFEQDRSARLERQARAHYCDAVGIYVAPACVQSVVRPWQRASLDGLSANGERVVEIKCGRATYDSAAARRRPARHHFPQLQHILAVTGLPAIDYWCYSPPLPALRLEVFRDDAYIERLLAAEEAFWKRIASAVSSGV
jgi:putative phage-type endonuclease